MALDILAEEIVGIAQELDIPIYIASVTVIGETPSFDGEYDALLDEYEDAQAKIADLKRVPFVDLRQDYKEYEWAYNCLNAYEGLLTYDGVHPTDDGGVMLGNGHALGIQTVIASAVEKYQDKAMQVVLLVLAHFCFCFFQVCILRYY